MMDFPAICFAVPISSINPLTPVDCMLSLHDVALGIFVISATQNSVSYFFDSVKNPVNVQFCFQD